MSLPRCREPAPCIKHAASNPADHPFIFAAMGSEGSMADMFSFEGVARLLSNRSVVLPAW